MKKTLIAGVSSWMCWSSGSLPNVLLPTSFHLFSKVWLHQQQALDRTVSVSLHISLWDLYRHTHTHTLKHDKQPCLFLLCWHSVLDKCNELHADNELFTTKYASVYFCVCSAAWPACVTPSTTSRGSWRRCLSTVSPTGPCLSETYLRCCSLFCFLQPQTTNQLVFRAASRQFWLIVSSISVSELWVLLVRCSLDGILHQPPSIHHSL